MTELEKDCLFCKIIRGEIPSYTVFENDDVKAFLDISQVTKGHTLIIPKKHLVNFFDYSQEDAARFLQYIPVIAQAIKKSDPTIRGLNVSSAKYGISGTCDAVEFLPVNDGITLHGRDGLWKPLPVEYKRGKSKISNCDRLQVAAQAVCLEEMFSCVIDYGFIFYKETRRKEKVEITAEMRDELTKALEEMHSYYRRGYTPRVKPSKKCEKCSLSSECMPSLLRSEENVDAYIRRHMEESENA